MPWRMTGGKDHPNGVVAEKIIIVRVFAPQKLPVYPRLVEVFPDVGRLRKPIRIVSILPLDPLHEVSRPREMADGAGVVEMEMRLQDVAYVFRPHVDAAQLVDGRQDCRRCRWHVDRSGRARRSAEMAGDQSWPA